MENWDICLSEEEKERDVNASAGRERNGGGEFVTVGSFSI